MTPRLMQHSCRDPSRHSDWETRARKQGNTDPCELKAVIQCNEIQILGTSCYNTRAWLFFFNFNNDLSMLIKHGDLSRISSIPNDCTNFRNINTEGKENIHAYSKSQKNK